MDFVFSALQVLAAYILADLMTGIYHFATDRGFNFAWIVELFQDHHRTNTMEGFDWQPMIPSFPGMLFGMYLESPFITALGAFGALSQIPHYYAHRKANRVVKFMQRWGIILSPRHHAGHHGGKFDCNFCILSGWNNWWLNYVTRAAP